MTWFEAYDRSLQPLVGPTAFTALLGSAEASRLLAALRTPASPDELAAEVGQSVAVVTAVCHALAAYDAAVLEDGRYRLAPDWMVLTDEAAFSPLSVQLAHADVQYRMLRAALAGHTYWTMSPEDRLVMARAVSPDPFSAGLVESFRAVAAEDPDQQVLAAGGTHLELGCGVAGRLLTTLQAVPAMHAIGVEISGDLAAVARERADRLGVADRLEVVEQDAADFDREACADTAFWSQFFFAEDTRAGALAALHRALRPGGVLTATLDSNPDSPPREVALSRVTLATWGVPARTPDELVAEVAAAGFTDVAVVHRGGLSRVRAVRP